MDMYNKKQLEEIKKVTEKVGEVIAKGRVRMRDKVRRFWRLVRKKNYCTTNEFRKNSRASGRRDEIILSFTV